jgi:hypothetical protein
MRLITRTDEPLWRNYLIPLKMFLFPHVLFSAIQISSGVAFLILLTSTISMVFSAPPYNFNTIGVGLMSMGPFVGNVLGSLWAGPLADWVVIKMAKRNRGIFEPEMRLYMMFLPALLMGVGLIVFGITAEKVSYLDYCLRSLLILARAGIGFIPVLAVPFSALAWRVCWTSALLLLSTSTKA